MMTSRERVRRTLDFDHPDRVPRQLWDLPITWLDRPAGAKQAFQDRWPADITQAPNSGVPPSPVASGSVWEVGSAVDEWGCIFENIQEGVHGEVKAPILADWSALDDLRLPVEKFDLDVEAVNTWCRNQNCYVHGGGWARPFERIQFLRGTENVYMDLALESPELKELLRRIHQFNLDLYQVWARTDVDALVMMDDWGAQRSLLINPVMWREWFKPLYAEYAAIAHDAGKHFWMHSDGYIQDIYPDLIEVGVDALNSQLFCMDIPELGRRHKGQIAFWGEIDRQHVLPDGTVADVRAAVAQVVEHLYDPAGGVIAQFSWEGRTPDENADAVYAAWDEFTATPPVT